MSRNRALAAGLARGSVERDQRVIDLEAQVAQLEARIRELEDVMKQLEADVTRLEEEKKAQVAYTSVLMAKGVR